MMRKFKNLCLQTVCLVICGFGLGFKLGYGGNHVWFNVLVFVILCATFSISALMLWAEIDDRRFS